MRIDDPIGHTRALVPEETPDPIGGVLQIAGAFLPLAGIVSAVESTLNSAEHWQRVTAAIRSLCNELERTQDRWPSDMQTVFGSVWFKRMLQTLIEESGRSVNEDHAQLLARVAAQGCFPTLQDAHRQEDLATYIHDLARLGEEDIRMLRLLGVSYRETLIKTPNLHDPNYFSMHYEGFSRRADEMKIHNDDRLSSGARLSGFGLAIQSPIPHTSTGSSQEFYRPSKRGFYLLSLLDAAELPAEKQN